MPAALVCGAALAFAPVAAAGQQINPLDLADGLLLAGEAAKACLVLDAFYGPGTENPEALVRYGECLQAQGDSRAIGFYEQVLVVRPDAPLVRARLAGLREAPVLAPAAITVAAITPSDPSQPVALRPVPVASGRVWLERYYDSNINSGTSSTTIDAVFAGIPLVLDISPAARSIKDQGTRVGGQIDVIAPLSANSALAFFAAGSASLHDRHADLSRQEFAAGLVYMQGHADLRWQLQPSLQLGFGDGDLETATAGLRGRVETALTPQTRLAATGSLGRNWVEGSSARSGWEFAGVIGAEHDLAPSIELFAGLAASRVAAGSASESAWSIGPRLGVAAQLTDRLDWSASYALNWTAYDATIGLFTGAREDIEHRAATELTLDLPEVSQGTSLSLRYAYTLKQSTIDLYDSDRHEVGVRLEVSF